MNFHLELPLYPLASRYYSSLSEFTLTIAMFNFEVVYMHF